jgi:hypothetical protein
MAASRTGFRHVPHDTFWDMAWLSPGRERFLASHQTGTYLENLVGATGFEPVTLPVWLGLPEISLAELIGGTGLREDR